MNEYLKCTHIILVNKKNEMKSIFTHYIFDKANIKSDTFLDNEIEFMNFIKFCLSTRQRIVNNDMTNGLIYFEKKYLNIIDALESYNISELQNIVYMSPGVGQKIGSLIIELIYMYSKYNNEEILKKAYLPIDTHTKRILENSYNIEVPDIGVTVKSKKFIEFQESLNELCSEDKSRVYFDYLWFIGKVFCTKINKKNSRGFKLCNYCWIKDFCSNQKWR